MVFQTPKKAAYVKSDAVPHEKPSPPVVDATIPGWMALAVIPGCHGYTLWGCGLVGELSYGMFCFCLPPKRPRFSNNPGQSRPH